MESFNKVVFTIGIAIIIFATVVGISNKENVTVNSQKQIVEVTQEVKQTEMRVENLVCKNNELQTTVKQIKKTNKKTKKSKKKSKIKVIKTYSVPKQASSFKTYMSYKCITMRSSPQYKLQHKSTTKTDKNGLRYTEINGKKYIHIALGSYYGSTIGTKYRLKLSTGKYFYGILADQKANVHTNSTHQYTRQNGDVIEFIIDNNKLNRNIRMMGDVSAVSRYKGKVIKIEKLR